MWKIKELTKDFKVDKTVLKTGSRKSKKLKETIDSSQEVMAIGKIKEKKTLPKAKKLKKTTKKVENSLEEDKDQISFDFLSSQ
jgi:hypothetical protein